MTLEDLIKRINHILKYWVFEYLGAYTTDREVEITTLTILEEVKEFLQSTFSFEEKRNGKNSE